MRRMISLGILAVIPLMACGRPESTPPPAPVPTPHAEYPDTTHVTLFQFPDPDTNPATRVKCRVVALPAHKAFQPPDLNAGGLTLSKQQQLAAQELRAVVTSRRSMVTLAIGASAVVSARMSPSGETIQLAPAKSARSYERRLAEATKQPETMPIREAARRQRRCPPVARGAAMTCAPARPIFHESSVKSISVHSWKPTRTPLHVSGDGSSVPRVNHVASQPSGASGR